jgi:hypothetical protein
MVSPTNKSKKPRYRDHALQKHGSGLTIASRCKSAHIEDYVNWEKQFNSETIGNTATAFKQRLGSLEKGCDLATLKAVIQQCFQNVHDALIQ